MDESIFMIELPAYTVGISALLEESDLIVHNFPLGDGETIYDPPEFQRNKTTKGVKYNLLIDTNIFDFLIKAAQGKSTKQTRAAVALVVFCQLADIDIEPVLALHEIINHDKSRAVEAVEKLVIFDRINNTESSELALFALEHQSTFSLKEMEERNREDVASSLTRYRRLREWDSIYLLILFVVKTDLSDLSNEEKLESTLNWMVYKFRKSLPVFVYCVVYFGKLPVKKMMKFKRNESSAINRSQIENMTWDLFIINHFFRTWVGADPLVETLYASDDAGFKTILRRAIEVQYAEGVEPLRDILNDSAFSKVKKWNDTEYSEDERMYSATDDAYEYRAGLISELEEELEINS